MPIIDAPINKQDLTSDSQLPTDEIVALEDASSNTELLNEHSKYASLVSFIDNKYRRSKDQREFDEERWLKAYRNYRGIYSSDVAFRKDEKSQAFIKITKTKVLAAYAQILDILFSSTKFPIGFEPTPVPVGILESVHFDPKGDQSQNQAPQQGAPAPTTSSTIARPDIFKELGLFKEKLEPVKDSLKEGPGLGPNDITYEPAKEAARAMEKEVLDQLEEAGATKSLRAFIFDQCLFGTGIYKGPFALDKEYPKWDEKGKYRPIFKTVPDVMHVSIWDAYPDPDARNIEEAEYFIQRHKMSRTQLRQLKKRPFFRREAIEEAIKDGPNYHQETWEQNLQETSTGSDIDRYEVLEYWGILDREIAELMEFEYPKEYKDFDQVQINAWICNNRVLRVVLNPFTPARIPYYACPYELNPYSFFGVGVAENMEDTQTLMNGFIRLAVDNAALSANVILEVDETSLVDNQDFTMYPGKIFRREGGQPGQMINSIEIPNRSQECLMMFDKARQLADEATGMPSYAHGQAGITGVGRTASGMSMLMGAAKENIKSVIRNIDDYLLTPLGKSMFAFNMQFNFDKKFVGDLEVVAKGTESLMRDEIRSQKLLQFLQIASNPMDAPYVKRDYILRELAKTLDLDPDKVVNDPREAALQAAVIRKHAEAMGMPPADQGQAGGPPQVSDPTGSGGGNIGPGMAPEPGAPGFTGAGGGSPQAAQVSQQMAQGVQ